MLADCQCDFQLDVLLQITAHHLYCLFSHTSSSRGQNTHKTYVIINVIIIAIIYEILFIVKRKDLCMYDKLHFLRCVAMILCPKTYAAAAT